MKDIFIGSQIKQLRESKGISQKVLADAVCVTPQAVSKWERNLSYPDICLLPVIASFFGITLDTLFGMCG